MKKNIIFALFSAFMVIAIAVGFYMQWNPTVIVILLGMSFMGTICYLIGICRHLIMSRVIFCKEKIDKAYRKYIRKIAVNCSRKVNRWKLEDTAENHISLLSPIDDFKRHKEYIIRLKNAIDQPNVFNIALTGSYGAGKSSILKTFKAYYPEYHYVNVSLASFVEVNMSESDSTPKSNEDSFEEQLEYSILQQLFYHVKATNIPESRFGRIERTSRKKRIFVVVCILLFVVANLCLFCQEQVTKYFLIPTEVLKSSFLFGLSICVFILGICVILFQLILFIKKISIKNLTLDKATLEFEEKNVSIMNRYLDEILYLFQEKKYNIVIFEDIDRFENTHIFTKLRELNLILNQSEEIGRRIVFLYALKDDIFANAEERTKFFDYIVPVIPFVNASNSGDLFRRKISDLHIPEAEVSSSFITDISAFVNDMRVLTNVVNEFDLYRNLLDKKLNKEKLLAMILYKNLFPTDFSLLHQNKGVVYQTFFSAPKIRNEIREDDSERLKEIDSEIQAISEETLRSIEELRAVIVGKLLKLWPGDDWEIYCDGGKKQISSLFSEENILHILDGNIYFENKYYRYQTRHLNADEIKSSLGESYKYRIRKKIIQSVADDKIKTLRDKRKVLMDDIAAIDKYTLSVIAKTDRDIFEHVEIPKGEEEKYKVLKYFLEKGYIDEEYFFYISIFQEGRLTPSDQEFLLSIKFNTPKEFDYKLQEIPSLIQNLSIVDYDHKGILNKDLLEYCLLHEDGYEDKCDAILKQLVVHEQYIDLLYQFMQEGDCVPTFIKRLVHIDNVWKSLDKDINHITKDKDKVISAMFKYADINDIRTVNTSYPFNTYINDNNNYSELFENIDQARVRKLLDLLDLNVQLLKDDSNGTDTYSYLYENNMYALTLDNVKVIFKHNELPVDNLDSAIYTSIEAAELNELQGYVHQELPAFVDNLMLTSSNTHESSDTIVSLMDEDIKLDDIIKLIKHNDTLWDDCKDITDKDVVSTLFVENKIKMTFENVKHYCSCIGSWNIDGTLVAFMNCNEEKSMEEFSKLVESNDEHEKELLSSVVESDGINDKIAFSIFNNRILIDIWCKDLSQLNETRVRYVVDKGIISISPSTYQDIITEHPQMSKYLLCKNPDNIISEWDEFAFSITDVVEMLSWIEYKKYHNFILNKIELESITPTIANALLSYFSKSDSEFNLSLYTEAMEKSSNPALKVLASTCCIAKRIIAVNELPNIFAKAKGIFEGLEKQGEVYSISKEVEGAQQFMETLHQIKYIGQVKEKGEYLTGKVLKRKPK